MKKLIAALLVLCLVVGGLAGCNKSEDAAESAEAASPREGLTDLLNQMSAVAQQEFDMEIAISGMDVEGTIVDDMSLRMNGTYNNETQEMQAAVELTSGQMTVQLTDMIVKGNAVYINARDLYNVLFSYMSGGTLGETDTDMSAVVDSILGDATYLYEESASDVFSSADSTQTIADNLSTVLLDTIEDLDLITEADGTYTVVIEGENVKTVSNALLNDVSTNLDSYTDSLWSYVQEVMGMVGETAGEAVDMDQDEFKTEIQSLIDEVLANIDTVDFSAASIDFSLGYDESTSTYTETIGFKDTASGTEINITSTTKEAEVEAVTEPTEYITSDELTANTESLYGTDLTGDGTDTGEAADFSYSVTTDSAMTSFVDQDLAAYTSLTAGELTISGDSTVQVPLIGDSGTTTGANLSATGTCLYQQVELEPADDLETMVSEAVDSMKSGIGDSIANVSVSDLVINDDGSACAISVNYTDSGYGDVSMLVALSLPADNSDEVVVMYLGVYHDLMDSDSNTVLSELGQVMGVNLTTFWA